MGLRSDQRLPTHWALGACSYSAGCRRTATAFEWAYLSLCLQSACVTWYSVHSLLIIISSDIHACTWTYVIAAQNPAPTLQMPSVHWWVRGGQAQLSVQGLLAPQEACSPRHELVSRAGRRFRKGPNSLEAGPNRTGLKLAALVVQQVEADHKQGSKQA